MLLWAGVICLLIAASYFLNYAKEAVRACQDRAVTTAFSQYKADYWHPCGKYDELPI